MIRHRIEGESFAGLGAEVLAELQPKGEAAVNKAVAVVHRKALDMLGRSSSGTKASEAGQPPALRRGALRRSLKIRAAQVRENVVSAAVYTNHPGAGAQEYGGRVGKGKSIRLPARPYLRPALEQTEAEVTAILGDL